MEQKIKAAISDGIDAFEIQVINDSHKHSGHAGDDGSGQTHFTLRVVSDEFSGCSRMQRQRKINCLIGKLFEEGLHAIQMELCTLEESNVP